MDNDEKKQEMISKLSESRENITILQNMLQKERSNLDHELHFVGEAKRYLNEVLYELTGNEFYKNT